MPTPFSTEVEDYDIDCSSCDNIIGHIRPIKLRWVLVGKTSHEFKGKKKAAFAYPDVPSGEFTLEQQQMKRQERDENVGREIFLFHF